MEFRLIYQGHLKGNAASTEKQAIRKALHPQIMALWQQEPLLCYHDYLPGGKHAERSPFIQNIESDTFVSLVSSKAFLLAELQVTFLRPEAPGT
jgi:hypothetical protein